MKNEFLNKNNLKKVQKDLNNFIEANKWEQGKLILEWKGFVHNQNVNPQRNNASSLVSLQSILHECSSINFDRTFDTYLHIYIHAKATAGQGCADVKTFITYKDKKGKTKTCSNFCADTFTNIFDRQYEIEEEYQMASGDNVIPFSKNMNHEPEKVDISDRVYSNLSYQLSYNPQKASEMFAEMGLEFISLFTYTHHFPITVESIKTTPESIIFAHREVSTYNSLPEMITITKVPELKTISLESLKVEGPGYYHHRSDRLEIREEDKKDVLNFLKEFNSIK